MSSPIPHFIANSDKVYAIQFARAMENVSIGLDQDLMVDILISKVRVKIPRSGFAIYTDRKHHGISADILAIKWGIGLDKANMNLQ